MQENLNNPQQKKLTRSQIKIANSIMTETASARDTQTGEIPESVIKEITDHIVSALALLSPYGTTLTPEERQRLPKINDKTVSFVTKGFEYCQGEPEYLTIFSTLSNFQVCTTNFSKLTSVMLKAVQLASMISDTKMKNGSESFTIALDYYNTVKKAAKKNRPGAKEIYNELSTRFPGRKKKSEPDVNPGATEENDNETKAA